MNYDGLLLEVLNFNFNCLSIHTFRVKNNDYDCQNSKQIHWNVNPIVFNFTSFISKAIFYWTLSYKTSQLFNLK